MTERMPRAVVVVVTVVACLSLTASATGQVGTARNVVAAQPKAAAPTTPELPGGGYRLFPDRMFVALYGTPGNPALGVLGESPNAPAAVTAAKKLAAQYQRVTPTKVIPTFELIATVAAAEPGPIGNYTNMLPVKNFEPYVDAMEAAGGYSVIDLQPGRADFLEQAKKYESLLKRPSVGLALDPEWKLDAGQVPLTQVGHVKIDEVNRVARWLADLVRKNNLPPKVLVLHQFQAQMIRGRENLDTSMKELGFIVHADGHGTPGAKVETWKMLIAGLPKRVQMGWKNFYDEDTPMWNVGRTMTMRPTPYFVSYQ